MEKKYDTELDYSNFELKCRKCDKILTVGPVHLEYMGNGFPVDLFRCPTCGQVYIPPELALGKMLHVEKSLEDK